MIRAARMAKTRVAQQNNLLDQSTQELFSMFGASNGKKKEEKPKAPTTKKCPYCMSEIAIEATRCPHCTSEVR